MTDFLDEKRREIAERLKELKPLADEYSRLQTAAAALDSVPTAGVGTAGARTRSGPRRPRGATNGRRSAATARPTRKAGRRAAGRRAGRPKGAGKRASEALELVRAQPGIAIPELAQKMGIKQNYLYRVLPGLRQEGKVSKQGRGWHPKD